MEKDIYSFCNQSDKKLTKINSQGYVSLIISDNTILRKLKNYLIKSKLPLMKRKWNLIDINKKSRYIKAKERDIFVKKELNKGKNLKQICKENNFKYSTLYMRFYRKDGGLYV